MAAKAAVAGQGKSQKRLHLPARIAVAGAGVVQGDQIGLADLAAGGPAEGPHGRAKGENPDGCAKRDMPVGGKIFGDRLDGHGPAVHPEAPAPEKAERAVGFFGCLDLIQRGARAVGLFQGDLSGISHPREKHNQPLRTLPDVRIIGGGNGKGLLPVKNPGRKSRNRLEKPKKK